MDYRDSHDGPLILPALPLPAASGSTSVNTNCGPGLTPCCSFPFLLTGTWKNGLPHGEGKLTHKNAHFKGSDGTNRHADAVFVGAFIEGERGKGEWKLADEL